MKRVIDLDLVVSLLLVAVLLIWCGPLHGSVSLEGLLAGNRATVYGTLTSLDGALLGFVIATEAITVGLTSSPRLIFVRQADLYGRLWRSFHSAIVWLGIGTLTSLASLVFDRDAKPLPIVMVACACALQMAIGRVSRTVWILTKVIGLIVAPSKARPPIVVPDADT